MRQKRKSLPFHIASLGFILAACIAPAPAPTPPRAPAAPTPPVAVATATASPYLAPTATPTPAPPPRALRCGDEVTADTTLAQDLTCQGNGLIVAADNIVLDLGGHTISGPGPGRRTWPEPNLESFGIKVAARKGVTVRNGSVAGFSTAILVQDATDITIQSLGASKSYYGIYLHRSQGITVTENEVFYNTYGLHLQQSSQNRIVQNLSAENRYASPGGYGLYLYLSNNNLIARNTILANANWGLWFSESRHNRIYHNNIANNSPNVSDDSGENTWHEEVKREGNYWSDYEGPDADGDGIGDVLYQIGGPGKAQDPYPFARPNGWQSKTVPTRTSPLAPTPTPQSRLPLVYIALGGTNQVAVVDPQVGQVMKSLPLNSLGPSLALSPDGSLVYAADADPAGKGRRDGAAIVAIDTARQEVVASYAVPKTGLLAAGRDGKSIYVVADGAIYIVPLANGQVTGEIPFQGSPLAAIAGWKHDLLFVGHLGGGIDLVHLRGEKVLYTIPPEGPLRALATNRAGTRLYASLATGGISVVDTEQYQVIDRLAFAGEGHFQSLAVSPDGRRLYALSQAPPFLVAIELANKEAIALVPLVGQGQRVAVSPDGRQLYVAVRKASLEQVNALQILDAASGRSISQVDLQGEPLDMVVKP